MIAARIFSGALRFYRVFQGAVTGTFHGSGTGKTHGVGAGAIEGLC
jgi:hypothetical protein